MTTSRENPDTERGIRYEQSGAVATVTLCRPDVLNAQTPAMWTELDAISRKLPGDVRVVIVRGEGRAFSAGLDLSVARGEGEFSLAELARLSPEECAQRIAGFQSGFTWLRSPSLVTIAAVHGHAIGAGFQLALNCDMRVLADDARLSMAEVTLGLVPDLGTRVFPACRHAFLRRRAPPRWRSCTPDSVSTRWTNPYDRPVDAANARMLSPELYRFTRSFASD